MAHQKIRSKISGSFPFPGALTYAHNTLHSACEHHLLFSIAKYGMSFCTMGMSEEFKKLGIAINSLWQARPVFTNTLLKNFDNRVIRGSNHAEIYAEAAYLISQKNLHTVQEIILSRKKF